MHNVYHPQQLEMHHEARRLCMLSLQSAHMRSTHDTHFCFADTGRQRMHIVGEEPGMTGGTANAGCPRCAHDVHKDTLHTLDTVFSTFADLPAFHEG